MNTDKLKELALAATPGEWWIDSHGHSLVSHQEGGNVQLVFTTDDNMGPAVRNQETGNLSHWPNDHDASYIAAANPAAILALIAQRDELLAALNKYESARESMFWQCLSNPVYDAWGNQVSMSLFNEAHLISKEAIAKAVQP